MKSVPLLCLVVLLSLVLVFSHLKAADASDTDNDGDSVRPARNPRARGNKGERGGAAMTCRYIKGDWGECDSTTNVRTRTLTLKRGDQNKCEATKSETRKCKTKKACRYVKSQWNDCDPSIHMKERLDQLKPGSDSSCDPTRRMTKKCKGNMAKKQ